MDIRETDVMSGPKKVVSAKSIKNWKVKQQAGCSALHITVFAMCAGYKVCVCVCVCVCVDVWGCQFLCVCVGGVHLMLTS